MMKKKRLFFLVFLFLSIFSISLFFQEQNCSLPSFSTNLFFSSCPLPNITRASIINTVDLARLENKKVFISDYASSNNDSKSNKYIQYKDGFSYEAVPTDLQNYMYQKSYKENCTIPYSTLRYVKVKYIDFNGESQNGEIVCNKDIAQDLVEIFYELYCNSYPIEEISLVDTYQADDDLSMEHNNTSCFNYRTIEEKNTLSKHSQGLAIDINPFYNPYVVTTKSGETNISPIGSELYANREKDFPYKITTSDLCYQLFTAHGFQWGGNWNSVKDYQHFEKDTTKK